MAELPRTNMSRSDFVRRFTIESAVVPGSIPTRPVEMNAVQVAFISKMVMSELTELVAATIGTATSLTELRGFMQKCLNGALDEFENKTRPIPAERLSARIAEQADALVDILYYVENAAAKSGVDLDPIFHAVHVANESKKFEDGKYHHNKEGKVIKPINWQAPDVETLIKDQMH